MDVCQKARQLCNGLCHRILPSNAQHHYKSIGVAASMIALTNQICHNRCSLDRDMHWRWAHQAAKEKDCCLDAPVYRPQEAGWNVRPCP